MKVMCIKKQSDFNLSRSERYIAVDWDSGAFVIYNPGMHEIGIMDCSEGVNPELLHYKKR